MLNSLGRFDDATAMARSAVARDSQNPFLYCELAQALIGLERFGEARSVAEQAMALAPTLPKAVNLQCSAIIGQARQSPKSERASLARDAVAAASEGRRLVPYDVNGYLNMAQAQSLAGNPVEANEAVQEAIRLAPNSAAVWVIASVVALSAKNSFAAIAACRKALSIDPQNYAALNNLGVALQAAGRKREGNAVLARAAGIQPGSSTARRNLSRTGFNIVRWSILIVLIPLGLVAHVGLLLYLVVGIGSNVYLARHPDVITRVERWAAPLALRFSKEPRLPSIPSSATTPPTGVTRRRRSEPTWSALRRGSRVSSQVIGVLTAALVVTAIFILIDSYVNHTMSYVDMGVFVMCVALFAYAMVSVVRRRRRREYGR